MKKTNRLDINLQYFAKKKRDRKNDEQVDVEFIDEAPTVEELEEVKNRISDIEEKLNNEGETIDLTEEELESLGVENEKQLDELLGDVQEEATEVVADLEEVKELSETIDEDLTARELAEELVEDATKSMRKIFKRAKKNLRKRQIKNNDYSSEITPEMVVGAIVEEVEEIVANTLEENESSAKSESDEETGKSKKNDEGDEEKDDDIESIDETAEVEEKRKKRSLRLGKSARRRNHAEILAKSGFGRYLAGNSVPERKELSREEIRAILPSFVCDLFVRGNGNIDAAIAYRKSQDNKGIKNSAGVKKINRYYKSMNASNNPEGGFLIAPVYAEEIIKFVYEQTVFDKLKYTTVDMWQGNVTIPKQLNGAVAHFVGERRPARASKIDFGTVELKAKTLVSSIITTKDLLNMSSYNLEDNFYENLIAAMSEGIEQAGIGGSGREFTPQGVLTHDDITTIDASKLSVNAPHFLDAGGFINGDFMTYLRKRLAQTRLDSRADLKLMIDQDMYEVLYNQKTPGGGDYINRSSMDDGKVAGIEYVISDILSKFQSDDPTNRGVMIYGDWRQFYMGETTKLDSRILDQATVIDSNGNERHLGQERSIMTEMSYQFDCNLGRAENFIAVKNLKISNSTVL